MTDQQPVLNVDPPEVRCGMCGGRCRWRGGWSPKHIECREGCCWSSANRQRVGAAWAIRVLLGRSMTGRRAARWREARAAEAMRINDRRTTS